MILGMRLTDTVDDLSRDRVRESVRGDHPIGDERDEDREQPHGQVWQGRVQTILYRNRKQEWLGVSKCESRKFTTTPELTSLMENRSTLFMYVGSSVISVS